MRSEELGVRSVISMKKNNDIRMLLKTNKVYNWELAAHLGVAESTLIRWMRFDLDEKLHDDMVKAIEEIAIRKGKES